MCLESVKVVDGVAVAGEILSFVLADYGIDQIPQWSQEIGLKFRQVALIVINAGIKVTVLEVKAKVV